jgi:hypothetical protein
MRTRSSVIELLVVACAATASIVVASACSLDWDLLPADGGGPDGVPDGTLDAPADVADAGDAADDTGPNPAHGATCTSNGECAFPMQLCSLPQGCISGGGAPSFAPGVCVSIGSGVGQSCAAPDPTMLVHYCACGNRFFPSPCAIAEAGLELNTCTGLDGGYIRCGYAACPRATHFCQVSSKNHQYECTPWSSVTCAGLQDCLCAKTVCPGGTCDADGGVTLTCP